MKISTIIFILLCFSSFRIFAQENVSSLKPHEIRSFDQQKISEYNNKKEFHYDRKIVPANPSMMERLQRWFWGKLYDSTDTQGKRNIWRWSIYLICAIVVIYAILRLTNTNISGWVYGASASTGSSFSEMTENIHQINFDKMIEESIRKAQYNQAIRLYYLKGLKMLDDKKYIKVEKDKTNQHYMYELKKQDLKEDFRRTTLLFEYVCYGDFNIDQLNFHETEPDFKGFYEKINKA